ncbi:MAG: photosynthetic reaction center subunit H [Pseudomonadota bacterium]
MSGTELLTHYDAALISLWTFWLFFFGLVFYLQREGRREGYPLVMEPTGRVDDPGAPFMPDPKTFKLPHGHGERTVPDYDGDPRTLNMEGTARWPGSPVQPKGDPLKDGIGPAAWAERMDIPELSAEGDPKIIPMRIAEDFDIRSGDPDPRGMDVLSADQQIVGTVSDVWIDRGEMMIRYLEVDLSDDGATSNATDANGEEDSAAPKASGGGKVLVPMTLSRVGDYRNELSGWGGVVRVGAITAEQFQHIPRTKSADQVTLREEDKIVGYIGGGHFFRKFG